jgi:hypothetical protein
MVHFPATGNLSKRRKRNNLTGIDKSQGNIRWKVYFNKQENTPDTLRQYSVNAWKCMMNMSFLHVSNSSFGVQNQQINIDN